MRQGCFSRLILWNFDHQLSPNFHRFVILCICWDHTSEKTGLWKLPIVSRVFKDTRHSRLELNNWLSKLWDNGRKIHKIMRTRYQTPFFFILFFENYLIFRNWRQFSRGSRISQCFILPTSLHWTLTSILFFYWRRAEYTVRNVATIPALFRDNTPSKEIIDMVVLASLLILFIFIFTLK